MLLIVYQGICALVATLVAIAVLRGRTPGQQVTGAMVFVPLLLRVLLIK